MIDPKQQSEIDQAMASVKEVYPPVCWSIYQDFEEKGFNECQSFELTRIILEGIFKVASRGEEQI